MQHWLKTWLSSWFSNFRHKQVLCPSCELLISPVNLETNCLLQAPRTVSWIFPASLVLPYWLCRLSFPVVSINVLQFVYPGQLNSDEASVSQQGPAFVTQFSSWIDRGTRKSSDLPGSDGIGGSEQIGAREPPGSVPCTGPRSELFCTRDKLCPLFFLVYRYYSKPSPLPHHHAVSFMWFSSEYRLRLFGGH